MPRHLCNRIPSSIIRRKPSYSTGHPDQEAQALYPQSLHNNLQDGLQDNLHFQHYCHLIYYLRYPGQVGNQALQAGSNT